MTLKKIVVRTYAIEVPDEDVEALRRHCQFEIEADTDEEAPLPDDEVLAQWITQQTDIGNYTEYVRETEIEVAEWPR